MKAREASGAGLYGDVTAFQEMSSAAMYIKSRDKIKEAAVEVAKKRSKRVADGEAAYRDWETDRKSTRLNSSHRSLSRMPSSA